jgi:hypothetical protein
VTVYVNDKPFDIFPGMTVKHALLKAGLLREVEASGRVFDEWGNEISLDGALSEGARIYVR